MPSNLLRSLPSVSDLLESPALKRIVNRVNHNVVVARVRSLLDDLNRDIHTAALEMPLPSVSELAERIVRRLQQDERPRLRTVINATGVLFHPELGGPPLAEAAVEELVVAARDYASVELDLVSGQRAIPSVAVQELLCELTGCEAALVVQNHSAALWLVLAALAAGREAIVSRGEVVDVDGARLPDLARAAGTRLREVGATHQTSLADYTLGIGAATGPILRLQPTDYAIVGAAAPNVPLEELVRLGRQHQRTIVHDLGYGGILNVTTAGDSSSELGEPTAASSIKAGVDVAILSGDKLLGGPKCGIMIGKRAAIEAISAHPLASVLAVDKLALAALAGTLRLYRQEEAARRDIPLLRLLDTPAANLKGRAERLAPQLEACAAVKSVAIAEDVTYLGPAPLPSRQLATWCVAVEPASGSAERLAGSLRSSTPAVVARVRDGKVLLDLRSVIPRHDMLLVEAVAALKGLNEPQQPAPVAATE